ncbi:maleylacetoacetate isomerase [Novosphingobium cyanobacteriorum]|uniref:Maleylacetoacetate isomerase n=1 Tax=Novosphingobium cyanobacteriorum TaxID=3024215 RepID=A0ABT6CCS0_9SPHN|nr:maleylacetoacetate isomerase [Novosphingobium cyanobacteriorum]MDF8331724.1 maleylacetoacetate isomerase [Novosphingobium cyanobacteriorum]
MIELYGYWRSGTSYRTRIALNLKGLDYRQHPLDLRKGEHKSPDFIRLQPQGLVPALAVEGQVLFQSPAIIEWLEERYPDPPLLPTDAGDRAQVRAMAAIVGCDIHPLNNLRVLKALRRDFAADQAAIDAWAARWIAEGFAALEPLVARHGAGFAWGDRPGLVDVYLVPQAYSAERFGVTLDSWPAISRAVASARAHPAFAAADPARQPDAD